TAWNRERFGIAVVNEWLDSQPKCRIILVLFDHDNCIRIKWHENAPPLTSTSRAVLCPGSIPPRSRSRHELFALASRGAQQWSLRGVGSGSRRVGAAHVVQYGLALAIAQSGEHLLRVAEDERPGKDLR